MPDTTLTRAGEHWDEIALRVYGDEMWAYWLMQHNMPLVGITRFDAGAAVNTPSLPEGAQETAPWRF